MTDESQSDSVKESFVIFRRLYNIKTKDRGEKPNRKKKGFPKNKFEIKSKWVMAIFTLVLAICTAVQTRISCNVSEITHNATRPYLVVEDFKLRPLDTIGVKINHFVTGKRFIVDYVIRNKGQTPAYNVIDSVRTAILDSGVTLIMPPHNTNNKFIVGSEIQRFKQSQYIVSEDSHRKISSKLDGSSSDHWVYFWGKITYTDISDNIYWTEFGHRYIFLHDKWFPYKEYNRAK